MALRQRSEDQKIVIGAKDRHCLGGIWEKDGGDFGGNAKVVAWIAIGPIRLPILSPRGTPQKNKPTVELKTLLQHHPSKELAAEV